MTFLLSFKTLTHFKDQCYGFSIKFEALNFKEINPIGERIKYYIKLFLKFQILKCLT